MIYHIFIKGVHTMSDILQFPTREEFRNWLSENCLSIDGV